MRKSILSRAARLALAFTLLMTVSAPVYAADFYVIVDNFGRKARNAYLDVVIDGRSAGGPTEVTIDVFDPLGDFISSFSVRTDDIGFASTASFGNLFDLTGGQPMVIRARTVYGTERPAATLHIDSLGVPLTIGLMPAVKSDGTVLAAGKTFAIALGTYRSASLLIANISGSEVSADVFKGSPGGIGQGIYTHPRLNNHGIWRVDLTQNEAISNLIVTATDRIIVQVVLDDGRTTQSFMVLPAAF